jgi:hypothetical protein
MTSPPEPDSERILLLECRLEKASSALDDARADADRLRSSLAEAAAREADHAHRSSRVHQELAEARSEIASLHERLGRSEALRAELEGHLFEAGKRVDAVEMIRLRRELLTYRHRALISEDATARLRSRVDELLMSRETLLTRVAEWQRLVRLDDPGAVDLGEFIAELRHDIMSLEQRNNAGERREAALRERLTRAGIDPDEAEKAVETERAPEPPTDRVVAEVEDPLAASESNVGDTFEGALTASVWSTAELERVVTPGEDVVDDSDPTLSEYSEVASTPVNAVAANGKAANHTGSAPIAGEQEPRAVPVHSAVDGLNAADPSVRAAALEKLIRGFAGKPADLEIHLRSGFADVDPRVRRRAVLAAATVRKLSLQPLLEPLRADPDPHVRRVVREVLKFGY